MPAARPGWKAITIWVPDETHDIYAARGFLDGELRRGYVSAQLQKMAVDGAIDLSRDPRVQDVLAVVKGESEGEPPICLGHLTLVHSANQRSA